MTGHWTERLSEYLDGELPALERASLEAHLAGCAGCARTLEELRVVAARAARLQVRPPGDDLWPGIAERLEPRAARTLDLGAARARRWSFTLPQLAAAGLLLMLLSGGAVWLALTRRPAPAPAGISTAPRLASAPETSRTADTAVSAAAALPAAYDAARYDAAIAELEGVLREHRGELDPATVRAIEENLRIIDRATGQARRALAADPASPYLNGHLAEQLKLKVALLRQAAALVGARG
ncbi:MAG: zf-HC2 domain-containing protein [Candidatus Eisenbacteria bacterium]|nr:zf-HC2 domain-containing protein [Candidatus Eisenbacteria bacterium]